MSWKKNYNWTDKNDHPVEPHSYRKDTHLKPGEPNPKEIGIDGYEYEKDMLEDYTNPKIQPRVKWYKKPKKMKNGKISYGVI